MARKKKHEKVIERYLPRNYPLDRFILGELTRAIRRNFDTNPYEFRKDYEALPELEKLRESV